VTNLQARLGDYATVGRNESRSSTRIPSDVPDGVRLAAGMTATVQVDPRLRAGPWASP
jgi:hypothetical protein